MEMINKEGFFEIKNIFGYYGKVFKTTSEEQRKLIDYKKENVLTDKGNEIKL